MPRIAKLLWLLGLVACVPHVAVDGAPCPCPSGYACCPTLSACVRANDPDACPSEQEESSGDQCARDTDCEADETCHAWKNADGKLGGPRECRKACSLEAPCAAAETCQLVPHDGASLHDADLIRACVADVDNRGCTCSDCDDAQAGRTYCEGQVMKGCFLAFNEACGVSCETVTLENCSSCETRPEGAHCEMAASDADSCSAHPCGLCPEGDRAMCDGNAIVSCIRAAYAGEQVCSELCILQATDCPAGSTCTEDASAWCAPPS